LRQLRYYLSRMSIGSENDLFQDLFEWCSEPDGRASWRLIVSRRSEMIRTVPCPDTGRPLRVATVDVSDRAVCPACAQLGAGGYISFVSDLRLAFACPSCRKLIWIAGS
jgi:hypothetical protein